MVHRDRGAVLTVRASGIELIHVVVGATARALRIRDAGLEPPVRETRDAVRAREGAEVVIERAVLLHDEDQVLEVVDTPSRVDRAHRVVVFITDGRRTGRGERHRQHADDGNGCHETKDGREAEHRTRMLAAAIGPDEEPTPQHRGRHTIVKGSDRAPWAAAAPERSRTPAPDRPRSGRVHGS